LQQDLPGLLPGDDNDGNSHQQTKEQNTDQPFDSSGRLGIIFDKRGEFGKCQNEFLKITLQANSYIYFQRERVIMNQEL
jgi:hypothetical protein